MSEGSAFTDCPAARSDARLGRPGLPPQPDAMTRRPRAPCLLLAVLAVASCARAPDPQYFEGDAMGTTYHVTLTALPDRVSRAEVQAVIDEVLDDADAHLSTWRDDSEISRFNSLASVDWVPVSDDLRSVLGEAQRVAGETQGAFDVTVAPIVDLWGFGRDTRAPVHAPSAQQLHDARDNVGRALLEVQEQPPAIRKRREGVRVDVAGIAPGFAVDRIAERLRRLRVKDALVELGGEVRAWGRNPDGVPWIVAVEAPVAGERRVYALVQLDGQSISTSGDYRDFRLVDGTRVSHTIDPRTGLPVDRGLASVSVVHPSAMTADAYATALIVLGPGPGLRFATEHHLAALLLERVPGRAGWREHVTPEFARLRQPRS